jgi:hypothetical protein
LLNVVELEEELIEEVGLGERLLGVFDAVLLEVELLDEVVLE